METGSRSETLTTAPTPIRAIRTFRDLDVYNEGFALAMEVFHIIHSFPKEELYALSSQMRNASRSVPANIAEGWAKRRHEMIFKRHLIDAIGSVNEMSVWLDMALACRYLPDTTHGALTERYQVLARRLHQLMTRWKTRL